MKKRIVLLMCVVLTVCMVGCGKKDDTAKENVDNTPATVATEENRATEDSTVAEESVATEEAETAQGGGSGEVTDSASLLMNVWDTYEEADRFPIGGGDSENMVMDVAGAFDVSKAEELDAMLGMPADGATMIDDAASMMHMMNANTFTSGAYHLSDAANRQALADLLKDNIMNRQWMCGFPDTLVIASVGDDYMVSAFGEAQIMENFKTKLLSQYEAAEVIYEENLSE